MQSVRFTASLALGGVLVMAGIATAQGPAAPAARPAPPTLPLKHAGAPTGAAISAADLMTRLYVFADDSMMGREVGTPYHLKATAYLEREVRKLGLVAGGDSGTYFQNLPLFTYSIDGSTMKAGDVSLALGRDFIPLVSGDRQVSLEGISVVYGGMVDDSTTWLSAAAMAGKAVLFGVPATVIGFPRTPGLRARVGKAAVVLVPSLTRIPLEQRTQLARGGTAFTRGAPAPTGTVLVYVTPEVGTALFGPAGALATGAVAIRPLSGALVSRQSQAPGRNVIAILPGSDPQLKGQYIAIGAHNDHVGFDRSPVDHDSLRAFNLMFKSQGADSPTPATITAADAARLRTTIDSLHLRNGGARTDSIFNGADDDGSGSVSVLEIAEALAMARTRPKRSILFVWHAGEEKGLWGAEHFTDHPTVPRDSIVAQLNMDMVGRGAAADVTGELKEGGLQRGGPGYLQLVGSRRLSTELGDLIESVNAKGQLGFRFDYSQDVNGHPQNIYCRSDHYEYARYGIPIAFITTGGHADYHQVTDEPQYIDYGRMAGVATLVHDVAWKLGDLDHRLVVDKAKPDPKARCVQ